MAVVPSSSRSSSSSSGALTQLFALTRATDGTFDQGSIPATYNSLYLQLIVRSDRASSFDQISLQFNGDTASRYAWQNTNFFGTSSSITANGAAAVDHIQVGDCAAASATSGIFSMYELWILGYASTTWPKTVQIKGTAAISAGSNGIENFANAGYYNQSVALSRVVLFPTNGTNFLTGSQLQIYGIL